MMMMMMMMIMLMLIMTIMTIVKLLVDNDITVVSAALMQGNRSNCSQFASSKRLDWLVNRLDDSASTGWPSDRYRNAPSRQPANIVSLLQYPMRRHVPINVM